MSWFPRRPAPPPPPPPPPPEPSAPAQAQGGAKLSCSFCKKSQQEVKKLIGGPNAYICDECIVISKDLLDDGKEPVVVPAPSDMEIALDELAVGQRPAKRALVAALRRHLIGSAQPGSEERAPRILLV